MLMEHNENDQSGYPLGLQRLLCLQAIHPWIEAQQTRGYLCMGEWVSECGTYRCYLGWATEHPDMRRLGLYMHKIYKHPCWNTRPEGDIRNGFGISLEQATWLFSGTNGRTLAERKEVLDQIISDKLGALHHEHVEQIAMSA